jgi:hypothetical protein
MNPIAGIFMPWWGPAPGWQDQFMRRALELRSLEVILVGDAAAFAPWADVPRMPITMDEFDMRASEVAGVKVRKETPGFSRGQCVCELRPMMADMYPEVLQRLPWWGWGEWDCVWGDWDSYLTEERLARHDMISSSSYTVNGPFTLLRNEVRMRQLYRRRLDMVAAETAEFHLDERGMQEIVAGDGVRCLYPTDLDSHDRSEPWSHCTLRDGKLYRMDPAGRVGGELLNFHFPGTGFWPVRN